jgi:hypothetical protein
LLAGAFILGAGVLIGAGIILLCQYLGTTNLAASRFGVTPTNSAPRKESTPAEAAKPPIPRPKTMAAYLRDVEARIPKMAAPQREAIMEKLRQGDF